MKKFWGLIMLFLILIGMFSSNADAANIDSETSSVEVPKPTMAPPIGWKPPSSNGYSNGESVEFYEYDTEPYLKYVLLKDTNNLDVFMDLSKLLKKNVKMSNVKFKSLTPKLFTVKTEKGKKIIKVKEKRYGLGYLQVSIKDGEETVTLKIEVRCFPHIEDVKMRRLKNNYVEIKFDLGKGINLKKMSGTNGMFVEKRNRNKKSKTETYMNGKKEFLLISEKIYKRTTLKMKILSKKGIQLFTKVCMDGTPIGGMRRFVFSDITRKSIKKWKIGKWQKNLEYPLLY